MDPTTLQNIEKWLQDDYDLETRSAIKKMMQESPKAVEDAFYTDLSFGTGGMRGIMGIGSNRMNSYTVRAATQGLANYLLKQPMPPQGHAVMIGYDSRHHSQEFAEEAAKVLAANGIRVFLLSELRPTPLVSFGCRSKQCSAGLMITASHNPPIYNGYKVYWSDGAQILPPHDLSIISEVKKISTPSQVKCIENLDHPLIEKILEELDTAYLAAIHPLQFYPEQNRNTGKQLKVVYSSLHGTGGTLVPKALQSWGFSSVLLVDEQSHPDGDFPTVATPNPEEASALKLGIAKMLHEDADLLIATDPDTDRVGVAVKHMGRVEILNGNQVACILLEHICKALILQKRLPERAAFIKSIATTELFQAICDAYRVSCINVQTGFKFFAEKIREWEKELNGPQFIFGGEESYGYLLGTLTRDKDAITASALICEVALKAKLEKKTLVDKLQDLYDTHGFYFEKLLSIHFNESREDKARMAQGMANLRNNPPTAICNTPVNVQEESSNVLLFWMSDGSKLMVRPSGTEPKIKIYCGVVQKGFQDQQLAEKRADALTHALKELLFS